MEVITGNQEGTGFFKSSLTLTLTDLRVFYMGNTL